MADVAQPLDFTLCLQFSKSNCDEWCSICRRQDIMRPLRINLRCTGFFSAFSTVKSFSQFRTKIAYELCDTLFPWNFSLHSIFNSIFYFYVYDRDYFSIFKRYDNFKCHCKLDCKQNVWPWAWKMFGHQMKKKMNSSWDGLLSSQNAHVKSFGWLNEKGFISSSTYAAHFCVSMSGFFSIKTAQSTIYVNIWLCSVFRFYLVFLLFALEHDVVDDRIFGFDFNSSAKNPFRWKCAQNFRAYLIHLCLLFSTFNCTSILPSHQSQLNAQLIGNEFVH